MSDQTTPTTVEHLLTEEARGALAAPGFGDWQSLIAADAVPLGFGFRNAGAEVVGVPVDEQGLAAEGPGNRLRLSFSYATPGEIETGIARLADTVRARP